MINSVIALLFGIFCVNPEKDFCIKTRVQPKASKKIRHQIFFFNSGRLRESVPKVWNPYGKFPENQQKLWEASKKYGKYVDTLDDFYTVWKISGQSGIYQDILEDFWTV